MKNNARLHLQLILPVVLVFSVFGIVVHMYWGPQLLETGKERVIGRENDVLRNILPGLELDLAASDLGAVHDTLHHLESTNKDESMVVELFGTMGERIYPLEQTLPGIALVDPITINVPIMMGKQQFGQIRVTIDMHEELDEIRGHVRSLEILLVAIAAGSLLLLLTLQYLSIGRPILTMTKAAQRIAEGDLSTPVPKHVNKATGGLGSAFIHMQTQLEKSKSQIEQTLGEANDNATRYRTVLESIPGALLVLNQQGQIDDLNQATEDIFGYSREEITDKPCLSLFPDNQCSTEMSDIFNIDPGQTIESEKQGQRKDGSLVPLRLYRRIMDISGETKQVMIAIDITQILKTHQELRDAIDQAEKANRAKSEFLSRMSHELRTPLNAIIGFGQLLALDEKLQEAAQRDNVEEIVHAGEHLLKLIDEVLDLSSIEEGNIELHLEPVDLIATVNKSIRQMLPLAQKHRIKTEISNSSGEASVIADKRRLAQLLVNLISNAIKYNHEGGQVSINTCPAEGPDRVRVNITDTGPGIPPEHQGRLFRPFERLDSPYEGIEGTGIGLALCRRLVEAMNGTIGMTSQPGKGSTFWFELPGAVLERAAPEHPGSLLNKVLYIEDNPANMRLMAKLAKLREDMEMQQSATAEEGLEIAFRNPPALILMDINLPGMNGFEALNLLKSTPTTKETPVVAVTANAMREDIARIEASGFDNYLIKPISIVQFNELMDAYLPTPHAPVSKLDR